MMMPGVRVPWELAVVGVVAAVAVAVV